MSYQVVSVFLLVLSIFGPALTLSFPDWSTLLVKPHILGGQRADIKDFPYQVSLRKRGKAYGNGHVCGASILNERYVLTAAHCVVKTPMPELYYVVPGMTNLGGGNGFVVENLRIHGKYKMGNPYAYDVAVLRLKDSLKFRETIKPVSLVPVGQEPPPGSKAVVAGYGRTIPGNKKPELDYSDLMKLEVAVVDRKSCDKCLGDTGKISEKLICAGVDGQEKKDASLGDSGGPLVDTKTGMQIGIISFGASLTTLQCPGAYTNIAHEEIRTFIDQVLAS